MTLKEIATIALAEDAATDPDFESKHPRGNSANKGQFRKSEKTLAKLDEADASLSPDGRALPGQSPASEYAAVIAKYKGTPQWLKAPNGKPTKLTERQWVQVRTPSFKKWFGDWENKDSDFSVVMDRETDEPLVVYHGTCQAGFRAFDNPESPTDSGDGTFWFTDDRKAAERFAGSREDVDFSRQDQSRAVYPVFLNIRRDNVEYEDFHGAHFDGSTGGKFEAMAYNDELYENYDGISYFRTEEDLRSSLADEGRDADEYEIRESEYDVGLDTRDFGNQVASDSNPDAAFILYNVVDTKLSDGHVSLYGYDRPVTEFILKNPKNVKSATSNSGAFSPDRESILDSAPSFGLRFIAALALAEDAAISSASAESSAGNIDLSTHDRRFHPHGYDPDRDSCSLRNNLSRGDRADDMSSPSPEVVRTANALRSILAGITVEFSDKPYSRSSDTSKSIRKEEFDRWNKIIDDYERGTLKPNSHLTVLEHTPPVLLRLGANDLPININKDTIDKIGGLVATHQGEFHKIPPSELRNLQIELDNPIAVFYSKSRNDSLVVLTRIIDRQNNERAVVALHLDKTQGAIQVNDIASVYGKDRQSIENWTAWGLLGYVNKSARKASAKWFQLPPDSTLRAHSVLTEKDFSNEELGTIVPNPPADRNGGSEDSFLRSPSGRVVGEYDRSTGKVTLYPGAKVSDVVHEFSHGLWQFAEEEAAAGRRSLLDKMHEIAVSAPKSVKDAVTADYPDATPDVYLEECFTHELARRSDTAFAKAVASDEGRPWYRKAWGAIKSIWNGYASKHDADKADLDKAASLPPSEAADFILGEMARGKNFGTVRHTDQDGGKRRSIIGEKGASALGIGKLNDAKKMSQEGADRETIWRKTGWWRGKDGKWRVEIPDIELSRVVNFIPNMFMGKGHAPNVQVVEKLGDLVEKGNVLSAYPDLASVDVHLTHLPNRAAGRYDSVNNAIWIERDLAEDPDRRDELKSTLSHEIQHAIQNREGFARGGNIGDIVEAREMNKSLARTVSAMMKKAGYNDWLDGLATGGALSEVAKTARARFPSSRFSLERAYAETVGGQRGSSISERLDRADESFSLNSKDAHQDREIVDAYRSFSGETESRNVERRLSMTPDERAATPPWATEDIPENRQIVRDSAPSFDPRAFARYLAQT